MPYLLRFHADECVDARIIASLRRRGVDLVTAQDEGMRGADDDSHLDRAIKTGRILITADQDFLVIASALAQKGRRFPGIVFLHRKVRVGDVVRAIALLAERTSPSDLDSRVEWISSSATTPRK